MSAADGGRCPRADDGLLVEDDADAAHLAGCADCRDSREAYRRLGAAIAGGVSAHRPPDGWHARTVARALAGAAPEAARARRRAWLPAVAVVAAAAALLLIVWSRPRAPAPPEPRLAFHVVTGQGGHRGPAAPGDELVAGGRASGFAWAELRIYRDGRALALRCPSEAAGCGREAGAVTARLRLERGDYQLLLLAGPSAAPPPSGALDADLRAATAAGARLVATDTLHVD